MKLGYVDIGRSLTYSQAVKEVSYSRNVFTVTKTEALAIAKAAGKIRNQLARKLIVASQELWVIIGIFIHIIEMVRMYGIYFNIISVHNSAGISRRYIFEEEFGEKVYE